MSANRVGNAPKDGRIDSLTNIRYKHTFGNQRVCVSYVIIFCHTLPHVVDVCMMYVKFRISVSQKCICDENCFTTEAKRPIFLPSLPHIHPPSCGWIPPVHGGELLGGWGPPARSDPIGFMRMGHNPIWRTALSATCFTTRTNRQNWMSGKTQLLPNLPHLAPDRVRLL